MVLATLKGFDRQPPENAGRRQFSTQSSYLVFLPRDSKPGWVRFRWLALSGVDICLQADGLRQFSPP